MDDDARTVWCGNLSDKVTEDILYELFLQGGPVKKVYIPKDRDGKQRTYGFITYKHIDSVPYALHLFDGTKLFNRTINIKARVNFESQQIVEKQGQDLVYSLDSMLNSGQQITIATVTPSLETKVRRPHPYSRDYERENERYKERSYRNRSSYYSNDYSNHRSYSNSKRHYY